jgi:aldose 1-epimerase
MSMIRRTIYATLLLPARLLPTLPIIVLSGPAIAANIIAQNWGTTQKGEKVQLFTLKGEGGVEARITNFGGVVVNLLVPDRHSKKTDVVLGYDSFAEYEKGGVFSALIGPYANRLGLTFPVDGKTYTQPRPVPRAGAQQAAGPIQILHSGAIGFQKRVWNTVMHDGPEPSLALTIKNADGTGGFPGNVSVTVTYTIRRDNTVVLDYRGTTDKPTVLSVTNHFYFNLKGEGSGAIDNEIVTLYAEQYSPNFITSELRSTTGTVFDFSRPTRIGDRLAMPEAGRGFDNNMVVTGKPDTLRPGARIDDPDSGIVMAVFTTQPGFQFYTDNTDTTTTGKAGHRYGNHNAISIETEKYPDAPNHREFPSAEVTPDKPMHEVTEFRFATLP